MNSVPLIFDVEADDLLEKATVIHCIVIRVPGGKARAYHDNPKIKPRHGSIADALERLSSCSGTIAHNQTGYDYPVLRKLYPDWVPPLIQCDTLVCSRVLWSGIKFSDYVRVKRGQLPGALLGRHSLEAWGYRLSLRKGEYKKEDPDRFKTFDRAMLLYCSRDTEVTERLHGVIQANSSQEEARKVAPALAIEHEFAAILALQPHAGFQFDVGLSDEILAELQGDFAEVDAEARAAFPSRYKAYKSWEEKGKLWRGYSHKELPFNPGSRPQIARELMEHKGWVPEYYTDAGNVKLTNDMLREMPWPEAHNLAERFDVEKRLSQLDHGEQSWLNHVRKDGRIAAEILHNGTVTHRCTHKVVTSVPKAGVPHGGRMRELFVVPRGRCLVGWDASGLEARMLAHYLARFDNGRYAKVVLEGDIHQLTMDACGKLLFGSHHEKVRDAAKEIFYAWLYGAGDWRLGVSLGRDPGAGPGDKRSQAFRHGKKVRACLEGGIVGLSKLLNSVKRAGKKNGWLRGLDGRRIPVRAEHGMLNDALQSAGALVMKVATILFHRSCEAQGLTPFDWWQDPKKADFVQVGHWHDEAQTECAAQHAPAVMEAGRTCVRDAGRHFNLRIELASEPMEGKRWSETH